MRRRLYFHESADGYDKGRWYDNVPEEDFRIHIASSVAESVYAEECRCLVGYSGRVVRIGGSEDRPCSFHVDRERLEVVT